MSQAENDLLICTLIRSDNRTDVEKGVARLTRMVLPVARRFVLRNSGKHDEVDDLVQDVIVSIWQHIRKGSYTLQPDKPLEAYARTIIRNQWYKALRIKRVKHSEPLDPESMLLTDEPELFDFDRIARALQQLGTTCQTILTEFYLNETELADIAKALNKTYAAVKEQRYRCVLRLKALLTTGTTHPEK